MKISTNKGFSLIEILLVITLLSILFAILLTRVNPRNIIYMTEDNQKESDALTIYQALEQYAIKNNTYPDSIKNMPNNSSAHICKTTATSCNSNTNTQINLSSILVPTYMSKIPEYSTDTNNSGFYVVRDSNGKIGIGGVKQINNITFVKGLESQSFATIPIPPIVSNGLVLHLDAGNASSYPGTGTTWNDLSGNGNNGTFLPSVGGPTYSSVNGGAIVFDGNDYVDFGNSSVFNQSGGKSFTITCWALFNSAPQNYNPIFNKAALNGTWEYALGLSSSRELSWLTSSNGTNWISRNVGETISLSTWYYYSVGYDFTNKVSFASINGKTIFTSAQTGIYNGNRALEIGRHNDPTTTMNGIISNLNLYNRALTPEEIQQNFNATRGRFGL